MVKNMPINNKLSEKDIIDALGRDFTDEQKKLFAAGLVEELENIIGANPIAHPEKKTVDEFEDDLEGIISHLAEAHRLIKKIEKKAKKEPFINALLNVSSRATGQKSYKVDVADVVAFIGVARASVRHVRFYNDKRGPDTRLSAEIAFAIHQKYTKVLGKAPGIASAGKRGDGAANLTPYQRVCKIVSETKKIRGIGEVTLKQMRELSAQEKASPWPYFKPDISFLPKKT